MWILTQNERRILSTESMDEISVADPAEGKSDYAVTIHRRFDGRPFALGFYRQKDWALKVLKEILDTQAQFYSCEGGRDLATGGFQPKFVAVTPKVYRMPPDIAEAFVKEVECK